MVPNPSAQSGPSPVAAATAPSSAQETRRPADPPWWSARPGRPAAPRQAGASPTHQRPGRRQRLLGLLPAQLLAGVLAVLLPLGVALAPLSLALGLLPAPAVAEFQGIDYTLTNQNGQDFSGQNLAQTSFAGAQGREASFAGADLHGAILTQGAFPMADFSGADLSDALMDKVDLAGADFRNAVLRGVIATGSNFSGARIEGADFSDALIDRADQRALCREASGTNPVTGADTRLSLGCA